MKTAFAMVLGFAAVALAQTQGPARPNPARTFDQICAKCHGKDGTERAPDLSALRAMAPERIFQALTSGEMQEQAATLDDAAKVAIAEYLSDRKLTAVKGDASEMPNQCTDRMQIAQNLSKPSWNGWGADPANTRFQNLRSAGLSAERVKGLKLKWAFAFPGATSVYGQPTVYAGRVFSSADSGYLYSLNATTGCVYWSFRAQSGVRSAISIGKIGDKYLAFFGDLKANVYAVDADTGKLVWTKSADKHPLARVTGAPKLYEGRLYVPVSSLEENVGPLTGYRCCTFRGSIVAFDAQTGTQVWKTFTIPEPAAPIGEGPNAIWGPSGAGVWNSPTIDERQHALYIGTGDAYSGKAPKTTDSILALALDTGKILWSVQDTENDTWVVGCNGPNARAANCPENVGPDYDFGASPILKELPGGKRILVAGQKSGIVWAHDPDRQGAVVWKSLVAKTPPTANGEIVWGGAVDQQKAYFGLNSGGVIALQLGTGEAIWTTPISPPQGQARKGQGGAVTAMEGVLFSGGWDGIVRALSTVDGRPIWEFDTTQEFKSVNGAVAKGGSMGAPGPTVADGFVYVGSGYIGFGNGMPGNALLAFSAE